MKKNRQQKSVRLTALLLISVMIISACSAPAATESAAQEAQTTAQETKAETKAETTAAKAAETPASQADAAPGSLPLSTSGETITIGVKQSVLTEDYNTNAYTKWLEEQTGINLEFVYFANTDEEALTQLALMTASGEKLPDIIWDIADSMEKTAVFEYGRDGFFLDLKPYFEKYAYYWNKEIARCSKTDQDNVFTLGSDPESGALYAFPEIQVGRDMTYPANMVAINKKWLDAIGSEIPQTVEEMKVVLEKFLKEDPNGNSQADEIPFISYGNGFRSDAIEYFINAFIFTNDEYFFNVKNGELYAPYTTDEYRKALQYLNELYKEGAISPLSFSLTASAGSEMTSIYTPASQVGIAGVVGAHPLIYMDAGNEALDEYVALPPLKAATELGGYTTPMASSYFYCTFITSDCENPVLAFKLLDFMSSEDSFRRMRYGVEGEQWKLADEGMVNYFDLPAQIYVIDSGAWGTQNNYTWHNMGSTVVNYDTSSMAAEDDGSWSYRQMKLAYSMVLINSETVIPDEVVQELAYSAEESAVVAEIKSLLTDYVLESRAMFISGALDPFSDADWAEYVKACDLQGLQDYLKVAQAAYTRMHSN